MKKRLFLIWVFAMSFFLTMCGQQTLPPEACDRAITNAIKYINEYYFTNQTIWLDSALMSLNRVEGKCEEYRNHIALHKSHALFLYQKYGQAINNIKKSDDKLLPYAEFKSILINKIKAKQAGQRQQFQKQRKYYEQIVAEYDKYLLRNKNQVDSVLCQSDIQSIVNTQPGIVLAEKYYYKSKITHTKDIILELDSIQKFIKGNEVYFDTLKKIVNGKIQPNILLE